MTGRRRDDVFWTHEEDAERLSCTSLVDAIEGALDCGAAGEAVAFYEYKRAVMPTVSCIAAEIRDNLKESVLMEMLDPDDDEDLPESVEQAIEALATAVAADFVPWTCETTGRVEVVDLDARKEVTK